MNSYVPGQQTLPSIDVKLRDVVEDDLAAFFDMQTDPEANQMAAFTAKDPNDRAAFMTHWRKLLSDATILKKTILFQDQVVGNICSFVQCEEREVCYWIKRSEWGKGIASGALSTFLGLVQERPLYARVAIDNAASLRVLEKCGFIVSGQDRYFANARGKEIEETILKLN